MVNDSPRALVIRVAGTNCDRETEHACREVGFDVETVRLNLLAERRELLQEAQFLILPGGFSYGDDLGAGRILALELRTQFREDFRRFVEEGKLILGICNGFQAMLQSGLLPDPFSDGPAPVTLTDNDSGRFEDRWVHLRVRSTRSPFLKDQEALELPVAHGEGKFVAADEAVLRRLFEEGQVVLTYADPAGGEVAYPRNPNGSEGHVAGVCDPTGRVFGLMPHPERFHDPLNHPRWTRRGGAIRPDGVTVFRNAFDYLKGLGR